MMVKLTFLGTGTSQGVPVISCDCEVCSSADSHDKRLRTSALIETEGVALLIDAGPDFREQMLRHKVRRLDAVLLTHEHKDHMGGLDDVRGFNYTSDRSVDIYATARVLDAVRHDYAYAFGPMRYPGVPDMNLIPINTSKPFTVTGAAGGQVEVVPINGLHLRLPVMGFRIGKVGYITDFNRILPEEIEKLRGVEVLVVNALRRERHISHFTLDEAIDLSREIAPARTYITHISHQMGFYAEVSPELPEGVFLAYDDLVVEV